MFLKSDTTRQRFSQRLAQPRFGPLWFSPRAPRLGAEKKAPTTFDRPPPRRGWGADYSEPRHLGCYGARELFCGARQRRRYGALVFRGSTSSWVGLPRPKTLTNQLALDLDSCKICPAADVLQQVRNAGK